MAKQSTKRPPSADRILDAALDLSAQMRWRDVTMEKIAAEAGASLGRVHEFYPTRAAILKAFADRTDREVLAGHDFEDADEPVRERLLDILMRRFDALSARKEAVRSIWQDAGSDPVSLFCSAPAFARTMAWSLEAAGVSSSGPLGVLRVKGLGMIYLAALRVWFRDDSEDMSPTMAQLDKGLRRAESIISTVNRRQNRTEPA